MSAKADALLPGIVRAIREKGPEAFALNSIAEELGTSSRMLIYHFGGRDELLGRAMHHVRQETISDLEVEPPTSLDEAMDSWWQYYMKHPSDMQLFFHLASRTYESREDFEDFASSAMDSWIGYFSRASEAEGVSADLAQVLARLVLASLRGLVVDVLVSGDRTEAERALDLLRGALAAQREALSPHITPH
ncbi:TetR/AcrR family transcriptional regulator [Microbacterium trichothecenolyticum]|uniref:TetR/AcrR family transcriptional regulator n=1 Tax=Microbacterium ureisolvens TaxID=2781186 RepID=A0ABS7HYW3_9MICO|nr:MULTISPECIES: TetR/AcrR family transcriptional regulator [Microbacterium]MBW9110453.1 TetR/AcrR family transcriptional regulator [Microbacterium ureisolvens]MBW9120558.1 TetR/AcrR family transcriptional regulator [Microbacterium trichothecenolyticum]